MKFLPDSTATRLWLTVTLCEAISSISIEAIILGLGDNTVFEFSSASRNVLPVYLGLFCLAHVFQLVLAVDAISSKNTIQIIALCIFNLLFLIYAVVQIEEVKSAFEDLSGPNIRKHRSLPILLAVVPAIIGVAELCYIALSWWLYREFGWQIFKNLGADRRIKKMYLKYQIFICLVKFNIFFLFSFSMQFVLLVLSANDIEKWLTLACAPLALAVLAAGAIGARREIKWLMLSFMGFCGLAFLYFAFKLFRIYQNTDGKYTLVRKSLTVFSALSIVLLLGTFVQSILVYRNFGKGLARNMSAKARTSPRTEKDGYEFPDSTMHYKLESANSSRMSID